MMAVAEVCPGEGPLCSAGDAVEPSDSGSWGGPRSRLPTCFHKVARTVAAAYSLGKPYITIGKAKVVSLVAVILLLVNHSASCYSGGSGCQRGRVWEPDGCKMHNYSSTEAKTCLAGKQVVFIGDSRIWHLFISFINVMTSANYNPRWRHVDIFYRTNSSTAQVNFLWNPRTGTDLEHRVTSLSKAAVKPDAVLIGVAAWVIAENKGSAEGLRQYRANLTAIAGALKKLAQYGDVYWHLQEPVKWSALKPYQKKITNEQIDLYNEAAAEALHIGSSRIKALEVSRQAGLKSIAEIPDGLHMPLRIRQMVILTMILALYWMGPLVLYVAAHCSLWLPQRHQRMGQM